MFRQNNIGLYLDEGHNINFSIEKVFQIKIKFYQVKHTISIKLFVTNGILIKPQLKEIKYELQILY